MAKASWEPGFDVKVKGGWKVDSELLREQLALCKGSDVLFAVCGPDGNCVDPHTYKLYMRGFRYKHSSKGPVEPEVEWMEDFPPWKP